MLKIGVLASGNGTNFQAIIDQIDSGFISASISLLISDNPESYALKRAKKAGIRSIVLEYRGFRDREDYDAKLVDILKGCGVELVVMAGFMRIISGAMIQAYPGRIMNIHPSLLPAFPGLRVQKKAIEYGVKYSGATVHFIDEGVDTGPIIIQAAVPVFDDDTEETLSERILAEEHRIYPIAIAYFAEGRLKCTGRRVIVRKS